MRFASLALAAALLCACGTARVFQGLAEPYSVEASVTVTDAAGNTVVKGAWLNARFLAVDPADVAFAFVLRGPAVYGGPIVELRRFVLDSGGERQAWEIVLPTQPGEETRLVETTWEAARASIPSMPE